MVDFEQRAVGNYTVLCLLWMMSG